MHISEMPTYLRIKLAVIELVGTIDQRKLHEVKQMIESDRFDELPIPNYNPLSHSVITVTGQHFAQKNNCSFQCSI